MTVGSVLAGKESAGSWADMEVAMVSYLSGVITGRGTCARAPPPPTTEKGPGSVSREGWEVGGWIYLFGWFPRGLWPSL